MSPTPLPLLLRGFSTTALLMVLAVVHILLTISFFQAEFWDILRIVNLETRVEKTLPEKTQTQDKVASRDSDKWYIPFGNSLFYETARPSRDSLPQLSRALYVKIFLSELAVLFFLCSWYILSLRNVMKRVKLPIRRALEDIQKGREQSISPRRETTSFFEIDFLSEAIGRIGEELEKGKSRLTSILRERRDILSDLTHDLRTPMTAIEGALHLLRSEGAPHSDQLKYFALIQSGLLRQERLAKELQTLLEFRRQDIDQQEEIFLGRLLSDLIRSLEPLSHQRGITVGLDWKGDADGILGNRLLIERALLNLLENALRHAPIKTQVSITLKRLTKEYIEVTIQNTEMPFSAESPQTLRPTYGLEIARKTALLHGGDLQVKREAEQRNTQLFLPYEPKNPQEENITKVNQPPKGVTTSPQTSFLVRTFMVFQVASIGLFVYETPSAIRFLFAGTAITSIILFLRSSSKALTFCYLSMTILLTTASASLSSWPIALPIFGMSLSLGIGGLFHFRIPGSKLCWAIIITFALFAILLAPHPPWLFYLGILTGLWIASLTLMNKVIPIARKAGGWVGGLFIIGATFSSLFAALVLYYLMFDALHEHSQRSLPAVMDMLHSFPTQESLDSYNTVLLFQEISGKFPLFDFSLASPRDSHFIDSKKELQTSYFSDRGQFSGAKRAPVSYSFPASSFRNFFMITHPLLGEGNMLIVSLLGDLPLRVIQRDLSAVLPCFVLSLIVLLGLLSFSFAIAWSKVFSERISLLLLGLQNYAAGDLSQEIVLPGHDEFSQLAAALSSSASQVRSLKQEYEQTEQLEREFLKFGLAEILRSLQSLRTLLEHQADVNLEKLEAASKCLRRNLEHVFEIAYLEFAGFKPSPEQISLVEVLDEEILRFRSFSPGSIITSHFDDEQIQIQAEPELLIRTIQFCLTAISRKQEGEPIMIQQVSQENQKGLYFSFQDREFSPMLSAASHTENASLEFRALASRWKSLGARLVGNSDDTQFFLQIPFLN